jgi:starch-binding outer membrane protein SusE/F
MKKYFKTSIIALLSVVMLSNCKKEENQVIFEGGKAPVATSSINATTPVVLIDANKDMILGNISWTNPEYKFNTGLSSQDVNYTIQIDTVGGNFKSPKMSETLVQNELFLKPKVSEFNKMLLAMDITPGSTKNYIMRIKSDLKANNPNAAGTVPLFSNVINFTATTYLDAKVIPPGNPPLYDNGELYLVGAASPGGWANPVPAPSQKFTRISSTKYELTVMLNGGNQNYLLLPVNGSWNQKFGNDCGSNGCNEPGAYDFKREGGDIKGPAIGGTYTIKVNFITGKIEVL